MDTVPHSSPSPLTGSTDGSAGQGLAAMLQELMALEALTGTWPDEQRNAAAAHARAIEALNAEAMRRIIRAMRLIPEAAKALRDVAQDEVVYAVLRRHGILKGSLQERIEAALASVRPALASHGGNVELVAVNPPVAEVRLLGACDGCPASGLTLYAGVKTAIQQQVPEITEVREVKGLGLGRADSAGFVSPFAAGEAAGWKPLYRLRDLPDGATRFVPFESRQVLLSRFGDRISCFENACAHMGYALDRGDCTDGIITCPHHGFRYALDSGECLTAPEVQLEPHAVRVIGDRIEIRIGG